MEEEYKVIEECNNYEISNLGNVRNIKTGRILKETLPGDIKDDYPDAI
jgi:hypothetical protein